MAFLKYANATVEKRSLKVDDWNHIRQDSLEKASSAGFDKSASVILGDFSPEKYLLSHCTIIASVDADEVPNVETGEKVFHQGKTINRPYKDYYITPDTEKYINQNGDAWERELLLGCYKTFTGAENYVEHIQIPDLSKGKVIDAVARDLDDTIYVDILVATDRKYTDLISKIESGQINTLSMGCSIAYSICTKCGNVAADEVELCQHVKYQKGNKFHDDNGTERIIAELCGHKTDLDSVKFIEASWVANPAFKGAVLRNIINEEALQNATEKEVEEIENKIQQAFTQPTDVTTLDDFLKAASFQANGDAVGSLREDVRNIIEDKFSSLSEDLKEEFRKSAESLKKEAWGDEEEEEEEESADPFEVIKDDVEEAVMKTVQKRIKEKIPDDKHEKNRTTPEHENMNDTIINSYQVFASRYASEIQSSSHLKDVFQVLYQAKHDGWHTLKNASYHNSDILAAMYLKDRDYQNDPLSPELYDCLNKVGGADNYANVKAFVTSCQLALGRSVTKKEAAALIKRAKYLT